MADAVQPAVAVNLGDGKERHLKFTLRAVKQLKEYEKTVGKSLDELTKENDPGVVVYLLQLGLRHEEPDVTEDQLYDTIDMRNMPEIGERIQEAFGVASPPPAKDEVLQGEVVPLPGTSQKTTG